MITDGRCKLNDFENLERRLTMTEERLVKRHIHQLGKIFVRIVFGLKEVNKQEIDFILTQLNTTNMTNTLFDVQITDEVKEFLLLTLNPIQSQMINWQQLINLKIFSDGKKPLSNAHFRSFGGLHLQTSSQKIIQPTKQQENLSEDQIKKIELEKQQAVEIQKTLLIFNKIIKEIDSNKVYKKTNRELLQILYLLTLRCMNNIKEFNLQKQKLQESLILKFHGQQIQRLEKQVTAKFYEYSQCLTQKENQKLQIAKDFLNVTKSILSLKFGQKKRRDNFLTGFQNTQDTVLDYSKAQQIAFTVECIDNFLKQNQTNSKDLNHVQSFLSKYKQISDITFDDLRESTFEQFVQKIIGKQQIDLLEKNKKQTVI